MKLLLAAATEAEITPLLQHLRQSWQNLSATAFLKDALEINICITGVGMMASSYTLTRQLLQNRYDFALQAGVAGSFDPKLPLGEAVFVTSDQYGDLGAEDHYNYLDIFDIGLLQSGQWPFTDSRLVTPLSPVRERITLQQVTGLTVNTVSGSDFTIKSRIEKYNCTVESMEGAAFHYVCLQERIPFAQVRSISNYITPRDKNSWKMKEAIITLNKWLIDFLEHH